MSEKSFFSRLKWQDFALIAIILLYLLLQINLTNVLEQLPSPVHGGDYYHQLGAVEHVKYGGAPFGSFFSNIDPIPSYLPLYAVIVGKFAAIFDVNSIEAMFTTSHIMLALSLILFYLMALKIFKNKSGALVSALAFVSLNNFPILKYREFAKYMIFPFFFFFLYLTLTTDNKKKRLIYAALTGLIYGLGSISHGSLFMIFTLSLPIIFIYMFIARYFSKSLKFDKAAFTKNLKSNILIFLIISIIGFVISLIYWAGPISYMISGESLPYQQTTLNQEPLEGIGQYFEFAGAAFTDFFNFGSLKSFVLSIITAVFIVLVCITRNISRLMSFLIFLLITSIIIIFHFVLTNPLLGYHLDPYLMKALLIPLTVALFAGYVVSFFHGKIKSKYLKIAFVVIVCALIIFSNISASTEKNENSKWFKTARKKLPDFFTQAEIWIEKNTQVNDVFLSSKELAYSVNSLTGRKVVSMPRGHLSVMTKHNEFDADLGVMIYGSNDTTRKKLFDKYAVKYFYWDMSWLKEEYHFDDKGNPVAYFDPVEVQYSEEYEKYFTENGVEFERKNAKINPNKRHNPNIPEFDVLIVPPTLNVTHPWNPGLDKYLKQVFVSPEHNPSVKIFRVEY
jgi:hypothetical protein